ncbi:MAG: hypothetical protein JWQ57_2470 [Mucilaginibacter sp.]|nr:hypothetical protein [Mucilaginibacter sp.]
MNYYFISVCFVHICSSRSFRSCTFKKHQNCVFVRNISHSLVFKPGFNKVIKTNVF